MKINHQIVAFTAIVILAAGNVSGFKTGVFYQTQQDHRQAVENNAVTGDVTAAGLGSVTATLATTGATARSYTSPNIAVDAKGRIPSASNGSIVQSSTHTAFGDSITCGVGAGNSDLCNSNGYANLLSNDEGAALSNYGISGDQACDQVNNSIMPHGNPSQTHNPIYTYMIGTNDANKNGTGSYENIYKDCHKAALAWMAIPSTYKTFAQACALTGSWTNSSAWGSGVAAYTTQQNASASCALTTYGGPLYIWYQHIDGDAGISTYSVDSGTLVSFSTATTPAIGPTYNAGTKGVGLFRITGLTAGPHTVVFTLTSSSGTLVLGGIGTPSPYSFWGAPKVYAGGVIRQQDDNISSTTAAYDADVQADVNLLAGDGLQIYFVPVRNYVNATTDMHNTEHPNSTGHGHLRDAFEAVEQFAQSISNQTPTDNATCSPGQIMWDSNYIYLCIASGTVKRAALSAY